MLHQLSHYRRRIVMKTHRSPGRVLARLTTVGAATVYLAACSDRMPTAPESQATLTKAVGGVAGGVYTSTNAVAGNAIVAYARMKDGSLSSVGSFATQGTGIGGAVDPLISQYAVILDAKHKYLYTVNAGSNDITVFRVNADASLAFEQRIGSGGVRPVSLALGGGNLYVVNAGDATVATFSVAHDGMLAAVEDGVKSFAAGSIGPTAIRVASGSRALIIANGAANTIHVIPLDQWGRPGDAIDVASSGVNPFGFDINPSGAMVISEAGSGSVSSYKLRGLSSLDLVTSTLSTGGAAPCWVRMTPDGRFAYTTNAGSSTLSGFAVKGSGEITALSADGSTGTLPAGSIPLDLDITTDGLFLYTLNAGTGAVGSFMIGQNGLLTAMPVTGGAVVARGGAQGLAAW
jgi:6-phosphogluconolactonase